MNNLFDLELKYRGSVSLPKIDVLVHFEHLKFYTGIMTCSVIHSCSIITIHSSFPNMKGHTEITSSS